MEWTYDQIAAAVKANIGGTVSDADALLMVQAGLSDALAGIDPRDNRSHVWSFLRTLTSMTFYATKTGTMAVSGVGSTTITDAVNTPFCRQMIGATLVAGTSGTEYTISGYTSTSIVTVSASAAADNGRTFTITPDGIYEPPVNFGGLADRLVYAYNANFRPHMEEADAETVLAMWRNSNSVGYTYRYALISASQLTSATQGYKFIVAPVPTEDMLVKCRHILNLAVPAAGEYLPGGMRFSQLVRSASLAQVEKTYGHTQATWQATAQRDMIAAIDADKLLFRTTDDVCRMRKG